MDNIDNKGFNSENKLNYSLLLKSLFYWFNYFKRKSWILIIACFLGGVLGVIFTSISKPRYQASTTFALEDTKGGSAFNLASELGIDIASSSSGTFSGDNIIKILKSRRIVENALLQKDSIDGSTHSLIEEFIAFSNLSPKIDKKKFLIGLFDKEHTYLQDSLLYSIDQQIINNIKAERPDKKLNMYEVTFISDNERFSKTFLERLLQKAIEFYTELRVRKSLQTIEVLEKRVGDTKGALYRTVNNKAAIQDANFNPVFAMAQVPIQQKQLDMQAYVAAYGELYKNLELARYQYLKDRPLLQIIDTPKYPLKKIKLGRLMAGGFMGSIALFLTIIILFLRKKIKNLNLNNI